MTYRLRSLVLLAVAAVGIARAAAQEAPWSGALAALVKVYPEFLAGIEGNDLVWKDGTRMRIDDGKGP